MGRALGFIGVLIAVGVGAYLYTQQAKSAGDASGMAGASPKTAIDVTGVKNNLIVIANAERRRLASDGKYVSLDELKSNGDISMPGNKRGPYTYSVETSDSGFRVTATYSGPDEKAPRSVSIDQTMQISTN
jgi:hypothetical protein